MVELKKETSINELNQINEMPAEFVQITPVDAVKEGSESESDENEAEEKKKANE